MPIRNSILCPEGQTHSARHPVWTSTAHVPHYGAGELDQHAIAGRLHDPAAMEAIVDRLGLSDRLEPGQRAFLVAP